MTILSDRAIIVALEAIAPDGRSVREWLSDDDMVAYWVIHAALLAVEADLESDDYKKQRELSQRLQPPPEEQ